MNDDVVTVRLSRDQAEFLQANLSLLAANTRQAIARPNLDAGRRTGLISRAFSLESIEDAVCGALLNELASDRQNGVVAQTDPNPKAPRQANELRGSLIAQQCGHQLSVL